MGGGGTGVIWEYDKNLQQILEVSDDRHAIFRERRYHGKILPQK